MLSPISSALALAPLLALSMMPQHTDAHTWIDCLDTDRSKLYDQSASYIFGGAAGNGFCAGYGAGFPGRGDGDIGTSYTYKLLKNEVEAGSPVCQNVGTDTYTNTDWRKRLSVAAGQTAYFAYLPNGHIVKDKKGVGTQHGVYWTGQVGTSLASTFDMKPENLVDGHTMDYDDGNCGETVDRNGSPSGRAGDGKPCIGSFTVPAGTAPGVYSMVWYWTFWLDNESAYVDQEQSKGYFGAAYSTCFEVEVTGGGASAPASDLVQSEAAPMVQGAAPMGATPAPGATPAAPFEQAAVPGATPAATTPVPGTPPVVAAAPGATPAPTAPEATPAPTAPEATPAPTTPEATPAATTPTPGAMPAVTPEATTPTPVVTPMVTPAPVTPVATPAVPAVTPAATEEVATPDPAMENGGKKGSGACRRK